MISQFLFAGLPYLAVALLVIGSIYRFRNDPYSYTALSSQFLEDRKLLLGSLPWHVGIFIVLFGHGIAFLLPTIWGSLTSSRLFLITVEVIGLAGALLALIGLGMLIARRLTSAKLQKVTTNLDLTLLVLLGFQVLTGIGIALQLRWGAAWATGTTTPYLWSLLTLRPELGYVTELPGLVQVHIVGAWVIAAVLPFTRLVHVFSLPFSYIFRPHQRVIWTRPRPAPVNIAASPDSRRTFMKGALGISSAGALLSVGFMEKAVRFFRGPDTTADEDAEILEKRLRRLRVTTEERELELERMKREFIEVARVGELDASTGKYFIDYAMRPALAFLGSDGFPILISAKCTHLGCTVSSKVDSQGRLLCPCHVSYFDVRTGQPNAGAPAKEPLPRLGWVLFDASGELICTQGPDGKRQGEPSAEALAHAQVFISKSHEGASS